MTRTAAREIAVMLIFRFAANPGDGDLDTFNAKPQAWREIQTFFDTEYYSTLTGEDKVFEAYPDELQMSYIRRLVSGVITHRSELDAHIGKYAKNWKIGRISKTAAAVLRTAMYEVLYMEDVPDAAAMNEAVELSKGYDEQETVSFINGVLGSFYIGEKVGRGEQAEVVDGEQAGVVDGWQNDGEKVGNADE